MARQSRGNLRRKVVRSRAPDRRATRRGRGSAQRLRRRPPRLTSSLHPEPSRMRQRRASRASKLEETCHRRRRLLARLADAAALARRDRRRRARVGISKISAAFRKTSPFARRTSTVGAPSRRMAEKTVLIREAYDLRLALHRKGMERSDATRGQGIEAGEAGARPPRPVSHRRRQYPGNRAGVGRARAGADKVDNAGQVREVAHQYTSRR